MPPFSASFTPGLLQTEPFDVRLAAGGKHGADRPRTISLSESSTSRPCSTFSTAATVCRVTILMPRLLHFARRCSRTSSSKPRRMLLAAIDQRDLAAEAVEDAGELDGDIAAALDQDALRQLLEMEGLVRRDDVLEAGDLRAEMRRAAGRDQDRLGANARAGAKANGVRILDDGARFSRARPCSAPAWSCRRLQAARSRGPCWRSESPSRTSARGTVQPKPAASSNSSAKRDA